VDQRAIDLDLQCLPVFLKACDRMVVLCGPTYLSRLWCILEVFVYVHMGGSPEGIEVIQVVRAGFEQEDAKAIEDAFDTFDARDCQCSDAGDKRRILAVIEAAFGSLDRFNCTVQTITGQVRGQLTIQTHASLGARECQKP